MSVGNYYTLLGVAETATDLEIRKAYIKKIRQFPNETHPEEFQLLTKAYKTLSDKELRRYYDAQLEEQRSVTRITSSPEHVQPSSQQPVHPVVQEETKNQPEDPRTNNQPEATVRNKKKLPILQILLGCAVLYILYITFAPEKEVTAPAESEPARVEVESTVETNTSTDETESADGTVTETPEIEEVEDMIPSQEQVEDFLHDYFLYSVEVIDGVHFSEVERFLDPTGKKLEEQRSYTRYLIEKGITEDLVQMQVKDFQAEDGFIVATTEEVYDIYYSDGSVKRKSFESQYRLRLEGQQLLVHELIFTNEVSSEDLKGPELNVDITLVEEFLYNYMADSVNAINYQDFSYVEYYLAANSKRYSEQLDYTQYLIEKGITEELLSFELVDVKEIGNQIYEATTRESYTIFYGDGTSSDKKFESRFHIIQSDGSFEVSELIYTKER
ncbi:J domain-containing protein [Bacillus timonensis]|uniref:J domain-containing protein n=1 Tax=Bacillus timonensis TaxID=1033734 RepID=A0A4S3PSP9_9BACI|nr:J domain-containing protein [Bacillus timonensis]THE12326.1 J domain-containing protein [Bacillus timonensis]